MERRRLVFAGARGQGMTLYDRLQRALADGHGLANRAPVDDERHLAPMGGRHVPAAVLIAVTERPRPGVILTQRPQTMRSHAGQIAFPGGKIDPEDADAVAAALREAEEELAMPRTAVSVIGTSDEYRSGSGFAITPVLGVITPDLPFRPSPHEVDDWFEAPLDFLLDPANHVLRSAHWQGHERRYWEIMWGERRIWGVTAGIIANLARRLNGALV